MNAGAANETTVDALPVLAAPDEAKILSFNVGHGDCTLVEYWREGMLSFRCLVDGGQSLPNSLLDHLRKNRRIDGGPDIDVLVLSHVDSDHQNGLPSLLVSDIRIGEYLGPCLPTFERLAWLFEDRVQSAITKAREFERSLKAHNVPIVYPFEGFTSRHAGGRVTLSVLSPAAKLLEKLSTANSGELANLLMHHPLPLEWLQTADPDEPDDDDGLLRSLFRRSTCGFPNDFPPQLSTVYGIDKPTVQAAGTETAEPNFFGNSVLNDTSLVIVIDVHLDNVRRKRILLTGDQENWSYLAARHPGGLGPDVLKAPHHGGRVYLGDRSVDIDSLYLWLRPRTVLVSANGRHSLPRLSFRDSVRAVGASLFCPNKRGIEPIVAGTVAAKGEKSCYKSYACSSPRVGEFSTISLSAHDERSDAYACVQGTLHTAPVPIVVIRQEIASPSEKIVRYTWGELEKNAKWIQTQLEERYREFVVRAPLEPDFFSTRVEQPLISWNSILPSARSDGMHHLAADPSPVLSFARAHRRFWAPTVGRGSTEPTHLYRGVTNEMLTRARAWVGKVPRMLLHANLEQRQVATGDRLDILQSVNWNVFDGLVANLLALPKEVIADEVRPALLPLIAQIFSAKVCSSSNPGYPRPLEPDTVAYIWLESPRTESPFPNLEHSDWTELWDSPWAPPDPVRLWPRLWDAALNHILLGNYFVDRVKRESWMDQFEPYLKNTRTFDRRFHETRWTHLWDLCGS
jgi:hypothetical protein